MNGAYDLILSKNTLKKGFVHPERSVEKRRLLNLDVDDAAFVRAFHDALKSGRWVMIQYLSGVEPSRPALQAQGRRPLPVSAPGVGGDGL